MAHFLVLVLLDRSEPRKRDAVAQVMRPYFSSDLEVRAAKCDGYAPAIGGAFDGVLFIESSSPAMGGGDLGSAVRPVSELPAPALLAERVTAIVSTDGAWLARLEDQPVDAWMEQLAIELGKHPAALAVALDCHH